MRKPVLVGVATAALFGMMVPPLWSKLHPLLVDRPNALDSEATPPGPSRMRYPVYMGNSSNIAHKDPIRDTSELVEQEKSITKLRTFRELVAAGKYRAAHLATMLSSDEGMWLKAAYLQAAEEMKWSADDADKATTDILAFLATIDPERSPDPMTKDAYHQSIQLLESLNRRGDGRYDAILKARYESTGNPDYLKAIVETSYKLAHIQEVPDQDAVAIVRESQVGGYLKYAKTLRARETITPRDRSDLEKYIQKHSPKSDWHIDGKDDSTTKLMKSNGVSESNTQGKSDYIYRQWLDLFFSKITDDISFTEWQALPNPSHELASALWTERDREIRSKVEAEILGLFQRHHKDRSANANSKKATALVNFAVTYLDLCLSDLVPKECREELAHPQSFGAQVAKQYLASFLGRPDASMALGIAKPYVEKITAAP